MPDNFDHMIGNTALTTGMRGYQGAKFAVKQSQLRHT